MQAPTLNCGAEVTADGVRFRVWAPRARAVEVVFESGAIETLVLNGEGAGFFSGLSRQARAGVLYRYRLDGGPSYPDPCSRFQPDGPHGHSMAVDPNTYQWHDAEWRGLDPARQVIYELHLGTFTRDGTFDAAAEQLGELRALGVTCIELMPVAEFAGTRGWGYDGVDLFAPYHHYGEPEALRRFVDRAHGLGLGVILDVVYNHVGADGNYLPFFSSEYFTDRHSNEWGETLNYYCDPIRQFAIDNAVYWISEFHLDGLRLDATQSIHDPSFPALLAELVSKARAAAGARTIIISGEDYLQRAELLMPVAAGGAGLDHLWNDDFHHASRVALTGNRGGYFGQYRGNAQELLSCMRHGFLFQGQYDAWRKSARGTPVRGRPLSSFIAFTQNHDQVANTLAGVRLHRLMSPGRGRVAAAMLLLGPHTPMLFMGQEFDASSPFAYFADYSGQVAAGLWSSRRKELAGFAQYAGPAAQAAILDPCAAETFQSSKLDLSERERHASTYRLYQDLLALRREDPVLSRRPHAASDGAVLGELAFLVRWFDEADGDRLLLINLGEQIDRDCIPEPLLAPSPRRQWRLRWSSDDPRYGGLGVVDPLSKDRWCIGAESATLLVASAS